ncbi:Protein LSM14 A [Gurleya vavrai]
MNITELNKEIEIISKSQIRYKGKIQSFDKLSGIILLTSVRAFGTEERECLHKVSKSSNVYDSLTFKVSNIQFYKTKDNWENVENYREKQEVRETTNEDYKIKEKFENENMRRNKQKITYRRMRPDQDYLNVEIPEKDFKLQGIIDDAYKIDKEELKKTSKNYYNRQTGFYDNFKK